MIFVKYILPALIVIVVAVLFGFLLGYLGNVFAVKKDERVEEVRSHLCGANCGGCGYAGCDAFAEALVAGKAQLSDCNPTSKEGKAAIAEVLGISSGGEETVAVVACSGGNRCLDKFDYQGYGSCTTAELLAGGSKACVAGCMGRGTCGQVCAYHAIDVNGDGYAEVDPALCTSCGKCIAECPKKLIRRIPKSAPVYVACANCGKGKEIIESCKAGCIGCTLCAKNCPSGAITMVDNLPVFDYSKCTGCEVCVAKCPRKVIKSRK